MPVPSARGLKEVNDRSGMIKAKRLFGCRDKRSGEIETTQMAELFKHDRSILSRF